MAEEFPEFDGPTIPARFARLPPDCPPQVKPVVPLSVAMEMGRRMYWKGVVFGGLIVGCTFIAGAAFGLTISGSTVTLEPSADPAAFADVVFVNDLSNGPTDTGNYTLSQDGMTVGVRSTVYANFVGADQITVTPPLGMNCLPANCTVTVIEGQVGRVTLLPYQGA